MTKASETQEKQSEKFGVLSKYLVERPTPLAGQETIQLVLIREVQDYAILRTEETRELNTVWTPKKTDGTEEVERVAFLATKQKGAESRELESLLRTWNAKAERTADECYLKSRLCMTCPRCVLFGATDVRKGGEKGANIKHRVSYATAFSLLPVDPDLRETHTFNGVDGSTQMTGQTLGERESVRPGSLFASIVMLRAVTEIELILVLKTILSCTRYGAETRIGGIVRNHLVGIVAAHEEILSPLELTLELAENTEAPSISRVKTILEGYKERCGTPSQAIVLSESDLKAVVEEVQAAPMDRAQLDIAYGAAVAFRESQDEYLKKSKKKE